MLLNIITPEKKALSDEVLDVVIPASMGELKILPNHAALVTTIEPGELRYLKNNEEISIAVGLGILEVADNKVSVLTDMAIEEKDVDEDLVQKAISRAHDSLKEMTTAEEVASVQVSIQKSLAQLKIKRRRRKL